MNKATLILSLALSLPCIAMADDSQLDERLNPQIEAAAAVEVDYSAYPSVRIAKNKVNLNGDDWSALARKYRAALDGDSLFSIVYLGDSHVQADFGGSVFRARMQQGRPAGRGMVIPFKLAGTNQPNDYKISTASPFTASKLMRTPWSTEMPFTGIGIKPADDTFELRLSADAPFSTLRLHTRGGGLDVKSVEACGVPAEVDVWPDADGLLRVALAEPAAEVQLALATDGDAVLGGIELLTDSVGVLSHSIGNNGATFSDYSLIDRFGSELARLHPDLVVVALGTNEAFGRLTPDGLRSNIDNLMHSIRRYSPATKVLLVGPAECYRRTYRGKRRRRRSAQVVNAKAATMARSIRLYAEEHSIPYYNHFAVAGNAASQRRAHLLGADGVHYTVAGYRLWGNLLADAVLKAMEE